MLSEPQTVEEHLKMHVLDDFGGKLSEIMRSGSGGVEEDQYKSILENGVPDALLNDRSLQIAAHLAFLAFDQETHTVCWAPCGLPVVEGAADIVAIKSTVDFLNDCAFYAENCKDRYAEDQMAFVRQHGVAEKAYVAVSSYKCNFQPFIMTFTDFMESIQERRAGASDEEFNIGDLFGFPVPRIENGEVVILVMR